MKLFSLFMPAVVLLSATVSFAQQSTTRIERPPVVVTRDNQSGPTLSAQLIEKEIRTDIEYRDEYVQVPYTVSIPYQVLRTGYRQERYCGYNGCYYRSVPYSYYVTLYRYETRYRQELRRREIRTETLVRQDTVPVQIELLNAAALIEGETETFNLELLGTIAAPEARIRAASITTDYSLSSSEFANGVLVIRLNGQTVTTFADLTNEANLSDIGISGENRLTSIHFLDSSLAREAVQTRYHVSLYGKKRGHFVSLGRAIVRRPQLAPGSSGTVRVPLSRFSGVTRHESRRFLDSGDAVKIVVSVGRESTLYPVARVADFEKELTTNISASLGRVGH